MNRLFQLSTAMLLVVVVATGVSAQDKKKAGKTAEAEVEPLTAKVKVSGVFESTAVTEIKADTKAWTQLKVKKVLPEGTRVKAGDAVIWFETDEYEKKLRDAQYGFELAKIAMQETEIDMEQFKVLQEIDRKLNEQSLSIAREDMKYFLDVDKAQRIKSANFSLKMSEGSLENAQEELDQLLKMYKEDELTEESEEIVLRRARRAVESSQFSLDSAKLRTKRSLEVSLPREEQQMKDGLAKQELSAKKTQIMFPLESRQKAIEFAKARFALDKEKESHEELVADGKKLVLKAQSDGVVYYGQYANGKWIGGGAGTSRSIKPGQTVSATGVIITIVDPSSQQLRLTVDEKDAGKVAPGQSAVVTPTAFADSELSAKMTSASMVPGSTGKFVAHCSVELGDSKVMPGMTGSVQVTVYENEKALVIPSAAVQEDDGRKFVEVVTGDNRTVKQTVKTGMKSGSKTEILKGLNEGDTVKLPAAENDAE